MTAAICIVATCLLAHPGEPGARACAKGDGATARHEYELTWKDTADLPAQRWTTREKIACDRYAAKQLVYPANHRLVESIVQRRAPVAQAQAEPAR